MTPETEAAWQKYRYENLLPRAIEEQRQNDRKRKISAFLLGGGIVFALVTMLLVTYAEKKFGIQIHDTWLEVAIGLPACLPAALGWMGVVMFKSNSVMELTRIGNTYVPKNP